MCGRFVRHTPVQLLATLFDCLPPAQDIPASGNVAPTQTVAAVRAGRHGRELVGLRWGLIPSWAGDAKSAFKLINARAETVAEKPAFRGAFKARRCLIPADGFYEWQTLGKVKQPYLFRLRSGQPFAFAGLWERWQPPAAPAVESCTLITTAANDVVRPYHDRMPVMLAPADWSAWLDRADVALLRPYPAAEMESSPVEKLGP